MEGEVTYEDYVTRKIQTYTMSNFPSKHFYATPQCDLPTAQDKEGWADRTALKSLTRKR